MYYPQIIATSKQKMLMFLTEAMQVTHRKCIQVRFVDNASHLRCRYELSFGFNRDSGFRVFNTAKRADVRPKVRATQINEEWCMT